VNLSILNVIFCLRELTEVNDPMELRHVRNFVALAASLNFTRAAERVHVTQSTLSHQIKQLEEELGKQLFNRIGKRVTLTEEGESFLAYASRALQEIDQGVSVLKDSDGEMSGSVRIGVTNSFNLGFIPECVAIFMSRHPTVHIGVSELSADAIERQITEGELDFGVAYKATKRNDLRFEALYSEEMVVVVGDSHPFAKRKRIRMVELHRQRVALLPREFWTRVMLDECFRLSGAEPSIVVEMNTVGPMISLVARTEIAAIVAHNVVQGVAGLNAVPLESPTPIRTPGILWKRKTKHPIQVQAFAAIIRQVASAGSRTSDSITVRRLSKGRSS
jgi:LysR family cyn operon transcriptional activator